MTPQQPNQPQTKPGQAQPQNPPGKPLDRPHVSPDLGREPKNQPGRSGQDAPRTEPSKSAPGQTSSSSSSSPRQNSDEEAQRREESEGSAGLTTKPPSEQQPRRGEERQRPSLPGYSDPGDPRRLEVEAEGEETKQ